MNLKRIGERIQARRKEKGLSLGDVSQSAMITPRSIVLIENGQAILDLECLLSICTCLDITPNQLLEGDYIVSDRTKLAAAKDLLGLADEDELEMGKEATVKSDEDAVRRKIQAMLSRYQEEQSRRR